MSHRIPLTESDVLDDQLEDAVPTQRRPKGVGQGRTSTLTPPPLRVKPGEEQHVDMKAILSEPPRLAASEPAPAFLPPPRTPDVFVPEVGSPRVVLQSGDDWSNDHTPPPLSSDLGSVAPLSVSEAPAPLPPQRLPAHPVWKVATASLAVAAAIGLVATFAPLGKAGGTQSLAAAGTIEEPPHLTVHDLPVVGTVEQPVDEPAAEPAVVTIDEVPIISVIQRRDRDEEPVREATNAEEVRGETSVGQPEERSEAEPEEAVEEPAPTLPSFNRGAAASALSAAAASAASCREAGTPAGSVRVSVTFAPSGRATTALVSGAFAGTSVGGCIARTFRSARVEPFSGALVTVHKTVTIR